jgi:flagellar biosynthesis protein FlhB
MAGSQSSGEKTQAPTPHRLQQAREQGQHWKSVDLPAVIAMVLAMVAMPPYLRWAWPILDADMQSIWSSVADPTQWGHSVVTAGLMLGWSAGPLVAGFLLVGVLVQFGLRGFQLSFRVKFHNPLANATQWLSVQMLWNLVKGLGKVAGMLIAAGLVLWGERRALVPLAFGTVPGALASVWHLIDPALWAAIVVFAVWGAADAVYQRHTFQQQLKMSHQDIKDEQKQQDGDPHVRQRFRGIRRQLLRRSLAAVDRAAVVLTNPTHAAVALAWTPSDTQAPRVVAKGWDEAAALIRERAYAAGVPIVQNPPLARSLMTSPLDQPIAEGYWREVSVVLIFILRRRQAAEQRLRASRREFSSS